MELVIILIIIGLIIYGIIEFWPLVLLAIVIGIIIYSVRRKKEKALKLEEQRRFEEEEARRLAEEERNRQEAETKAQEEHQLSEWINQKLTVVLNGLSNISVVPPDDIDTINRMDDNAEPVYDRSEYLRLQKVLQSLKVEAANLSRNAKYVNYTNAYNKQLGDQISSLKSSIVKIIEKCRNMDFSEEIYSLLLHYLFQLVFITGDEGYLPAALAAYRFWYCQCLGILCEVSVKNYGNVTVPFSDNIELQAASMKINQLEIHIHNCLSQLIADPENHFTSLTTCLYPNLPLDAEYVMWYYAKKKPFDSNKFEQACEIYHYISGWGFKANGKRSPKDYPLSELIARIYVKNELGGESMVETDKKTIFEWLNLSIRKCEDGEVNSSDGQRLSAALAWMSLYKLELEVLKHLVQNRVQLDENIQERLTFLSEGGTSSIKVYDVPKSNYMLFDSSAESWKDKDISVCFRNIKMKKISMNYSLALIEWKKAIPLLPGQKLSSELLLKNFRDMVNDFDGEVTMKCVNAKAVDLSNLEFSNAVLFTFVSERNRCVDILFHCEKFGRNINITILTLFTPSDNISLEEMEKYAIAIKGNTYVNSFRESILQTFDETLKEDVSVYGDTMQAGSSVLFE